jgi:hypothetical protein
MSDFKRCSLSLPADVVFQLDFCADKMKLSRSAFLSALLSDALPSLVRVLGTLPPDASQATSHDARRFRGAAADVITDQLSSLMRTGGQGDIFEE